MTFCPSGVFVFGLTGRLGIGIGSAGVVDEFVEGWSGQRSGEIIALHDGAAERFEMVELGLSFDPFGDGGHSQRCSQADYRCRYGGVDRVRVQPLDEAAVDLDDVDREVLKVAQRGVPGPEVIYSQPHA